MFRPYKAILCYRLPCCIYVFRLCLNVQFAACGKQNRSLLLKQIRYIATVICKT